MLMVMEAIQKRISVRKYQQDPVPNEVIQQLLEAARLAPSSCNVQPWRFVVVQDAAMRAKVARATVCQRAVSEAPITIGCCADLSAYKKEEKSRLQELLHLQAIGEDTYQEASKILSRRDRLELRAFVTRAWLDVGIAIEHIVLVAAALGLGTCWVQFFDPKEMAEVLGLPDDFIVIALLTVGYPAEHPVPRPRKSLEEIVCYNRWEPSH